MSWPTDHDSEYKVRKIVLTPKLIYPTNLFYWKSNIVDYKNNKKLPKVLSSGHGGSRVAHAPLSATS